MGVAVNGNSAGPTLDSNRHAAADVRRAREFYRYLQPDNLAQPQLRRRSSTFDVYHDHVPSLSHALTPFCQLTALRCGATKAMLNVMDRDIMYFLAEASMPSSSSNGERPFEFVEDPILKSCMTVPLQNRICELTLRLERPQTPHEIQSYVINDLTQSQFAQMEIITGPPFYRFYAGVPITTRDGINIGSLAIMDTKPRPHGLTRAEEEYLYTSAQQIVIYLETNRQAIEGRRSRRMAKGLEAFINGRRSIDDDETNAIHQKKFKRSQREASKTPLPPYGQSALTLDLSAKRGGTPKNVERVDSTATNEPDCSSSSESSDDEERQRRATETESRSHETTFARAANLLREGLGDLGEDGGVHILAHSIGLDRSAQNRPTVDLSGDGLKTKLPETKVARHPRAPSSRCRPIAISTYAHPFTADNNGFDHDLAIDDDVLKELMERYPVGHMWSMEEPISSSDEETRDFAGKSDDNVNGKFRRSSRRKRSEIAALRATFPNARQILFTPVWDAVKSCFTYGCFITTALETRSFSSTAELPFLNSFCSTVMAECSRLDTMMADKQKSDFVGTISHEMRSPLHGVLASVEFLADTELTSFQKSLVETIDSCGRTLLDTINHVLDYSKVNSFQKQWQAANKRGSHNSRRKNYLGPENSSKAVSFGAPPLLQLFGITNISAVLEEVVDGLVLGHTYNSGIDITDTSKEARGRSSGDTGDRMSRGKKECVEIIVNVQQGDWAFMTQPGAVRRIIMNITGNAIKYTSQGTIQLNLSMQDDPENAEDTKLMVLTVRDTGKGISQEFLASRLFMPFAQENALAPGTGLGLSIVRSIVLMLGGSIDVQSKLGVGTTVEVTLPMKRPLPGQVSTQNTPHSGGTSFSTGSSEDDSILLLNNQATDTPVVFYRENPLTIDPLAEATAKYVRDWYGLEFLDQRLLEMASVVIVEEHDLEHLISKAHGTPENRPALVVMCSVLSRHSSELIQSLENRLSSPVEFVAKPCGPNKLARAICGALEKQRAVKPRFSKVANLGVIPETATPASLIASPSAVNTTASPLQEMDLSGPTESDPALVIQATETFAISQASQNAQMAINDPSTGLRTPRTQLSEHGSFPFPVQEEEKSRQRRERNRSYDLSGKGQNLSDPSMQNGVEARKDLQHPLETSSVVVKDKVNPRVLLVDDNQINLKLLETFLKKNRKYSRLVKAGDGQQAVNAVIENEYSFDIIFMDISMPVMNGFEATRAIRDWEEKQQIAPGAMVIALTGLASGRDQSEGFDSGCDIYMTKPVSFKEVGRLLDNWEGHQSAGLDQTLRKKVAKINLNLDAEKLASASASG